MNLSQKWAPQSIFRVSKIAVWLNYQKMTSSANKEVTESKIEKIVSSEIIVMISLETK